MKTISLTIPMDYNALTHVSDMLHCLAVDLKHEGGESASTGAFGSQEPSPSLFAEQPAEAGNAVSTETSAAPVSEVPTAAAALATATETITPPNSSEKAATGVDLAPSTTNAEALIPWDPRIHAGSKVRLAKKPHGWKMKRGVAADLVATVEAELMAAMAASPANPVGNAAPAAVEPSATPAAPAPPAAVPNTAVVAAQPASPAQPTTPAQPAAPVGATTFPELMAKIAASRIDPTTVTAAVNKQGLQALPLLAARPDLIPAVAAELFPGG